MILLELTFSLNSFINQLGACPVHCKHVEIDATNLRVEVGSYRTTCGDIGLHDVANNFDDISIL
jgi:hypothetical protein